MNNYVEKTCPYCKAGFTEYDDIVVCSVCDMPHHRECWIENQGCTTFGCLGTMDSPDKTHTSVTASEMSYYEQDALFCTRCGHKSRAEDAFCAHCGSPMFGTLNSGAQSGASRTGYTQQAASTYNYRTQTQAQPQTQTYGSFTRESTDVSDDDRLISALVEKNTEYYIPRFKEMRTNGSKAGWNWCAFLFAPWWMIFRKMYGYAFAYLGVMFFVNLISLSNIEIGIVFSVFIIPAFCVLMGIFGNRIYLTCIEDKVAECRKLSEPARTQFIQSSGGTNVGAMIATAVVYGIIVNIMALS